MTFLTVAQLLTYLGLHEVVSFLDAKINAAINADCFDALVNEQDTSAFTAEEVSVATDAQQVAQLAIDSAAATISGYVVSRYPSGLTQTTIDGSVLPRLASKLAKPDLMLAVDETTKDEEKAAIGLLRDIQRGVHQLGSVDPKPATKGMLQAGKSCSRFDWAGFGR